MKLKVGHVRGGRSITAAVALAAVTIGLAPASTPSAVAAPAAPVTAPVVAAAKQPTFPAASVDAVKTPKLHWYRCYDTFECVTVKVPLDYDHPKGAKVELALLRFKARDKKHRIGSLFVNPGGPGGSATEFVADASDLFSAKLRDRFDIVGMDPRGIGYSSQVTCLNTKTQPAVLRGYAPGFPLGSKQEQAWIKADRRLGKGCSNDRLAKSMSTAEVARDMELMRRAVGDKKLSYLGFSYGTYLGQVYANMFPTRFRAITVDGVLDPVAWAGSKTTTAPLEARLDSAAGAWKALHEILVRCDRAGGARCTFAPGDPVANFKTIAARLRAHPIEIDDPATGYFGTLTYQDLIGQLLGALYDPAGYEQIDQQLSSLWVLTEPPNPNARSTTAQTRTARAKATQTLIQLDQAAASTGRPHWGPSTGTGTGSGAKQAHGFPYDNSLDTFASVACTDSTDVTRSAQYPAFAVQADKKAPYFGRAWLWSSSVCASDAFHGGDEDAYTGPFTTKTTAPVLFVGDYYDPATNYNAAVSASRRLPNSRLLTSDSFGHTAYGTSSCTTKAVDTYLLTVKLPKKGKVCTGDVQPFATDPDDFDANTRRQALLQRATSSTFDADQFGVHTR